MHYADIPLVALSFLFIVLAIRNLKNHGHSAEIYLIWYIDSFFFLLFYGMGVIAAQKNLEVTEVCGAYREACKSAYDYLTDIEDEVTLIGVLSTLALGPQLLTYFLSGLSGSAAAPRFVSQVASVAIWSIVKAAAGLGGILTAEPLAKLTFGKPFSLHDIVAGFRYTMIAFFYAAVYLALLRRIPDLLQNEIHTQPLRTMSRIHRFFTRNTRRPADPEPE